MSDVSHVTTDIRIPAPTSDTLEISRSLAASLAPGRHELSSRRLGHVYGDARMSTSARTRVVSELDLCGLLILSEPWSEPLVVAKRAEPPAKDAGASASHEARRVKLLADRAADEVARSGRPVALPAMTDEERDIVRERLRWRADLVTRSERQGSERHIVVVPI